MSKPLFHRAYHAVHTRLAFNPINAERLNAAPLLFTIGLCLLLGGFLPVDIQAEETTPWDAQRVVTGWLNADLQPLGATLGRRVALIDTYTDDDDQPLYHIVYLKPEGYVIVPADDQVEPILAFVAQGRFDPSDDNPLGALVSRDVPGRIARVRGLSPFKPDQIRAQRALDKWNELTEYADLDLDFDRDGGGVDFGAGSVSDERVAPFVESRWGQSIAWGGGPNCYNYYTPSNYVCGCVATAMSQLMRFHQHPTSGVGTTSFTIYVNDTPQSASLRGGNGSGGAYSWSNMVLVPHVDGANDTQCQAIGNLCYDAGVSVNMNYTASGSGTDTLKAAVAFVDTFSYSNAKRGYNNGSNIGANLNQMANPNLDAGYPILFGITGSSGGHAIVGDGYGYNGSTLYHHLNMGWYGNDDAWYNLPNINSSPAFTTVYKCVYNVYTSGSGEIISGRVTDPDGVAISGADITAEKTGGGTYTATTNSKGIYALSKVPAGSTYTVSVSKAGYTFSSQEVSTGTSTDLSTTTGNKWGIDFEGANAAAEITSPSVDDPLDGSSVTFEWNSVTGATEYWLLVGRYPGSGSFFSASCGTNLSQVVNNLPIDGSTVYVMLRTQANGQWSANTYAYTAMDGDTAAAEMQSPADASTFSSSTVTFSWSAGTGVTEYALYVGHYPGSGRYFSGSTGLNRTQQVTDLPTDGSTVYVRLGSKIGGTWVCNDYTYTAATNTAIAAVMQSPAPGGTLTSTSIEFSWSAGTGVTEYWLRIGRYSGSGQYFDSSTGVNRTQTVSGLPSDGSTIYVMLFSLINGGWVMNQYTYTALNDAGGGGAEMESPAVGQLNSSSVTFSWSAGTNVTEYWLRIGRYPGSCQYFNASTGLNRSQTVSGLPTNGSTLYVLLFSRIGSAWVVNLYTYTALNDPSGGAAEITSPGTGAPLPGATVTFEWSAGTNVTEYWLLVGTFPGSGAYYNASCGLNQSRQVTGLPTDGRQIHVRLFSKIGSAWIANDYTYTAAGG